MKAFVEILSGIVRVGPEADQYGKPFEFAVAFSVDGEVATIKGLVNDGSMKMTPSHWRAGQKALEELGLKVRWQRKK